MCGLELYHHLNQKPKTKTAVMRPTKTRSSGTTTRIRNYSYYHNFTFLITAPVVSPSGDVITITQSISLQPFEQFISIPHQSPYNTPSLPLPLYLYCRNTIPHPYLRPSAHQTHQKRPYKDQQTSIYPAFPPQHFPTLVTEKVFRHEFDQRRVDKEPRRDGVHDANNQ
jgi:hypothetical protein